MKILLTGSSGFLGRIMVKAFASSYDLYTIGRNKNESNKNHIQADLKVLKAIDIRLPKVNLVIHAAGKAHIVPKTDKERDDFFQVNLNGTLNLLNALESQLPEMFVFISTVSVYGLNEGELIKEEHPLNAIEPYGVSKIMAEKAILEWGEKNGVVITILRLPLLIGENPPGNLGQMIYAISKGRYFRIGKGTSKKSMVLAADVAAIIPFAAEVGGVFNLTDGYHPSFFEIENTISSFFGKKKIYAIPSMIATLIAYCGDAINYLFRRRVFPLDTRAYTKITGTYTISDEKARCEINWKPKKVLEHLFDYE